MLMCWNEEPRKRPTFSELRARFDAMLLAERKDAYIDLRIDNDKPYYRLDTSATKAANGLCLSPNPSHHSFIPSPGFGSKECSPKPLHTPDFSPGHKSQASCCSSAQASPRKPGPERLTPSLNSFGSLSPCHDTCEHTRRASDAERRGRDHTPERGRPVSMLLPSDRERRERQNPYVDEPSRVAAMSLALPNGNRGHAHSGSDGAIELSHLRNGESQEAGIQITVTEDQN